LLVTDSEEKAMKFYEDALRVGEEGIMIKRIDAPYRQGRKVGYMAKMKPLQNDLDLVIVGAEYGTGKRGGWLTSYIVACRDEKTGNLVEVGKVSSGLKEKEEEGTTYDEMTKLLKPLVEEDRGDSVKIKPKVVVSVNYQNVQESPSYSSGFALRFPRITAYRPDRRIDDVNTLADIKESARKAKR
jgi:DNA ligase-1